MSNSYWKNQSLLPSHADIVIVGGGYIGLSTAYWLLVNKPDLDIVIIDSQELGLGASGRNAGFLTKGSLSFYEQLTCDWGSVSAHDIFAFAQESIDLVSEHLKFSGSQKNFSYSNYAHRKEFFFKGFERVKPLVKHSIDCFKAEGEVSIDPLTLLLSLESRVKELNAKIFRGVECFKMDGKSIYTGHGDILAGEVVIALNGYTQSLIPDLVLPQRAQMLCLELTDEANIPGLMYAPEKRVYFKSIGNKRIVIGGKRLIDPITEETLVIGINAKIQAGLEDYVKENLGEIHSVLARWSGIMGFSPDELPIVEKRGDYYLIIGFSGHGMGFGFNSARNLSDMIINNKTSFFESIRTHCRVKKP